MKNKYVAAIARHIVTAAGVYLGLQTADLESIAAFAASGIALFASLYDKYKR